MVEVKAPLVLGIQITGRCNLACKYCYAVGLPPKDLPFEECLRLFQELKQNDVFQVIIEGGEPFLHPAITTIVENGLSSFPDLAVLSNGTSITEKTCIWLAELRERFPRFGLQISLDSHIPEINDTLRAKGQDVLENIELLLSHGIEITIATVVHRYNVDYVRALIEFFYPRIRRFHFMNLMRTARKGNHAKAFGLGGKSSKEFWKSLKLYSLPSDLSISYPDDDINREFGTSTICAKNCLAGIVRAYITPELDLLACNIADSVVMGNLCEVSLREAWFSCAAERIRNLPYPPCAQAGRCYNQEEQ